MEKLIELLNEYLSPFSGYMQYHNENGFKRTPTKSAVNGDRMLQDEYVLGKSFGFIKWLVENDKIDTNNLSLKAFKNIFSGGGFVEVSDLEVLLMLLAISDTPIEDLISYLK